MKHKILKLIEDGKTNDEISELLNCSKSLINKYRRLNNLSSSDDVLELRKKGKTYDEIYDILNGEKTREQIRIICSKNGLSNLNRCSLNKIEEIRKIYLETKNIKETSRILNIDKSTIRRYILDIKKEKIKYSDVEKKQNSVKSVILWRQNIKLTLVKYKGGKCRICGYNKSIKALHFHHLDPTQKDFTISGKSWSFERLKNEVDKCILVCSNCHCEIHDGLIDVSNYVVNIFEIKKDIKITQSKMKCEICLKDCYGKRCKDCFEPKRKVENRPSIDNLIKDVEEFGYCKVGRKYGVSDNTIRKWIKNK
jgi:DNA-binding CsgD family transcriptional regulator